MERQIVEALSRDATERHIVLAAAVMHGSQAPSWALSVRVGSKRLRLHNKDDIVQVGLLCLSGEQPERTRQLSKIVWC